MSETRDGKLLTFVKSEAKLSSFLADLSDQGNRLLNVRHFPRSDISDAVVDWAMDSNTFFAVSNRTGKFGIYKQRLDQDVDEPIVTEGYGRNPFVVPGGQSIVYLGIGKNGPWPNRGPEPVMRVSTDGGVSRELFVAAPYSLLTCPRAGARVIGEPTEDGRQLVVTDIDAEKGRGAELFRFDLVAGDESWWLDISPDGRRVAILRTESSPLHVLSLDGHVLREVQIKGVENVTSFHWAADGNGFFIGTGSHNAKKSSTWIFRGTPRCYGRIWAIVAKSSLFHPRTAITCSFRRGPEMAISPCSKTFDSEGSKSKMRRGGAASFAAFAKGAVFDLFVANL